MKRNTVAVIVTYNRLDALKITVPNSLAEPFSKVVVVNNASTDGTREWLESLQDPRLELIHCEVNGGGAGGFNPLAKSIEWKHGPGTGVDVPFRPVEERLVGDRDPHGE